MALAIPQNNEFGDGKEKQDFPILCGKCMGDHTFVKMTRVVNSDECKMCQRVFTVYHWKRTKGTRANRTIVCPICATMKNICQCCLTDLELGIPMYIRDSVAQQHSRSLGAPPSTGNNAQRSDVMTTWNALLAEKAVLEGGVNLHLVQGERATSTERMLHAVRHSPYAKSSGKKAMMKPPLDTKIKTLYVGGLVHRINEDDLRMHFKTYGVIKNIKMVHSQSCAFITFWDRDSAELAAEALYGKLVIKNHPLKIMWAKPKAKAGLDDMEAASSLSSAEQQQMLEKMKRQQEEQLEALQRMRSEQEKLIQLSGAVPPPFLIPPQGFDIPPPPGEDKDFQPYPSMIPNSK